MPHTLFFDYKHNMEDESADYKLLLPSIDWQTAQVTEHIGIVFGEISLKFQMGFRLLCIFMIRSGLCVQEKVQMQKIM